MTRVGERRPRLRAVPPYERTRGQEVRDVAALAGLQLDGWQADVLDDFAAESPSRPGRWNTLENCLIVSRQNGKGGALEAYVLACLFVWDDPLVMYSAHRFDTAREMFLRIKELIAGCPSLSRRVRKVSEAHGKEGIHLRSGARLLFHARSEKAARGFSGDKTILDEAFKLDAGTMGAIMPTMSARPNPQIVYASSAGWEISEQLGRLRRRALASVCAALRAEGLDAEGIVERLGLPLADVRKYLAKADGADASLAFLEWSCRDDLPRTKQAMADPALWAQANPALGIRITREFVAAELRTMGAVEFARERLGVSDYPPDEEDEGGWEVIAAEDWADLRASREDAPRPGTTGLQRVAFAIDARPDLSKASIGAAFRDEDGLLWVETVAHRQGIGWVVPWFTALAQDGQSRHGRYEPCAVAIDAGGPAAALISPLENAGVEVFKLGTAEVAQAFGQWMEAATDTRVLRHLDEEPLNEAVKGAAKRPLGNRFTWDVRGEADITPVVAATNAAYAHGRTAHEDVDPLTQIW